MHLLITCAASPLARSLAASLGRDHTIRLTEQVMVKSDFEFVLSPLGHDASTNLLVRGMDAIVHVAQPLPGSSANEALDFMTRCTYNLLTAAAQEGVARVVYLSSLALMADYDPAYLVDERWRPRPRPEPPTLTTYLGESVCREFAREHKLSVAVLRLAPVTGLDEDAAPAADAIDGRHVADAVSRALTVQAGPWSIYHIAAGAADSPYSIEKARNELGFEPQHSGPAA